MNVILLKDLSEDCVDAVILAKVSTANEIQQRINEMKSKNVFYDWEDLMNCLPSDCVVYDKWSNLDGIYY